MQLLVLQIAETYIIFGLFSNTHVTSLFTYETVENYGMSHAEPVGVPTTAGVCHRQPVGVPQRVRQPVAVPPIVQTRVNSACHIRSQSM